LATAFDGMIDRLDGAFQRQRRFTADASHELRTPLTIIRSQAEVALARPREPAYYARVLSSIREEAERLGHLVESLLIMARADAGRALTLEPVDLEEIVAEAGARVATRAHERGIRLAVEIESTHPVRGDATWLTQLLSNLLDNALRHTPSGGQVTLSVGPAPDGALLKVADTGEGIAPEHLPHLFERFYRADQARSRSAGGTGLGLAICDWVARMHGGRLEVDSTLGRGTTFSLWLPLAAAPAPAPSPGPAPVGRPAAPAEPAYHSVS
jgi:signal transduction histidine kinase